MVPISLGEVRDVSERARQEVSVATSAPKIRGLAEVSDVASSMSFPTRMTQPVGGFLTSMTQED